jgi:hypothetical protein
MLDIRKLGEVLFMKRKKQVFRASLTFIALSFLLIGSLLNNKEDYFYRLKGETTYSCALPAGYVEINTIASTALTLTSHGGGNDYHNKVNTDTFRGTVTRKAGNTAYIQRRNQSNGELDSLYLWGVGAYSDLVPGAVIDISGGMIVNYYGNPEIKGFTYTVPFATNPYGYGPLVYNSVSDFNINAFTNIYDNSALNYSRLVKVKNVTLNALITEGAQNRTAIRNIYNNANSSGLWNFDYYIQDLAIPYLICNAEFKSGDYSFKWYKGGTDGQINFYMLVPFNPSETDTISFETSFSGAGYKYDSGNEKYANQFQFYLYKITERYDWFRIDKVTFDKTNGKFKCEVFSNVDNSTTTFTEV